MSLGLDDAFVAAVGLFALRGWFRGFIRSAAEVVGLLLAYVALWTVGPALGGLVAARTGLQPLMASVLVGMALFLGLQALAALAGWLLARRRLAAAEGTEPDGERLGQDRYHGALLGIAQGVVTVFLVALILGLAPPDSAVSRTLGAADSGVVDLARRLAPGMVGRVWATATGDPTTGALVAGVLRDPAGAAQAARTIAESPAVLELRQDPEFARALTEGSPDDVARNPRLAAVFTDPAVAGALASFGVDTSDVRYDPAAVARLVGGLRRNIDALGAAARDAARSGSLPPALDTPEMRRALESGDPAALMQQAAGLGLILQSLAGPQGSTDGD